MKSAGNSLRTWFTVLCLLFFQAVCLAQNTIWIPLQAKGPRYRAKGIKGRNIDSLFAFVPQTDIFLTDKHGEGQQSDSLSAVAHQLLLQTMQGEARRMRMAPIFSTPDTALQARIRDEQIFLAACAIRKDYNPPPDSTFTLDSLVQAAGLRYALISFHLGFISTDKPPLINRGPTPAYAFPPYGSLVEELIYDTYSHKIVFFVRDDFGATAGANPVKPEVLRRHFLRAFHQFYWLTPPDLL